MNNIFNNYAPQNVSDKGKTQATLHSRFARVGELQEAYNIAMEEINRLRKLLEDGE